MTRGLKAVPKQSRTRIERKLVEIRGQIKKRRRELNLNQEMLAEELGLTGETIGGIEQGRRTPSLPVLILILDALGLKLEIK